MKYVRFVLPFLFVRNWYTGDWEVSPVRMTLFTLGCMLLLVGVILAYMLQAPIQYDATVTFLP